MCIITAAQQFWGEKSCHLLSLSGYVQKLPCFIQRQVEMQSWIGIYQHCTKYLYKIQVERLP